MNKIVIIGCPGAGKTAFARKLSDSIGIELYHLDMIWHRPDKTHISREEFDETLGCLLAKDSWIVDGNYLRTMERRILAADTVFFFDLPTEICLRGATERLGRDRSDIPWSDNELDPTFKLEIEHFSATVTPKIYELLDKYKCGREVIIFKTREETNEYFN